jgi:hypothetical protein
MAKITCALRKEQIGLLIQYTASYMRGVDKYNMVNILTPLQKVVGEDIIQYASILPDTISSIMVLDRKTFKKSNSVDQFQELAEKFEDYDAVEKYLVDNNIIKKETLSGVKTPTTDAKADIERRRQESINAIKQRPNETLFTAPYYKKGYNFKQLPTDSTMRTEAEEKEYYEILSKNNTLTDVSIQVKTREEAEKLINAKYDAELAALEQPTTNTKEAILQKKEEKLANVKPVYHYTTIAPQDFNFNSFQREIPIGFGNGLNASSTPSRFLAKKYANNPAATPIQGEVNDKDFIEIDANKSQKEVYEMLVAKGYKFNNPQIGKATPKGATYTGGSATAEYDDTDKLNYNPGASIDLFIDFQQSNPEVKGVKILNHIIGKE